MPANGKVNGRFELPQLTPVNYSLTDGTDIPPPPDSPIEEKAPISTLTQDSAETTAASNGQAGASTDANGSYDGRGRTSHADQPPLSPTSTTRPGSIRRFLSRKSLNSNYTNGTNTNRSREDLAASGGPERPGSSLSQMKKSRSGSWFRRLGSANAGSRTSVVYETPSPTQKAASKGPPPPKLPELNQLKAKIADDDEGSLGGGDLFKNIK